MNFSADRVTLARYDARSLMVRRDMSAWSFPSFIVSMRGFINDNDRVKPEVQALDFYLMNHAVSEVRRRVSRSEQLNKYRFILDDYHEGASKMALRTFYYLLYITVREARHYKGSYHDTTSLKGYDEKVRQFFTELKGKQPGAVLERLLNSPPQVSIGVIVNLLDDVFNECPWPSGNFGGSLWGQIALCLKKVVTGVHSMEIMLDEAWALEHNTGAIFNKNLLFDTQDVQQLTTVLDVQRAGMIPQFVGSGFSQKVLTQSIGAKFVTYQEVLGDCFSGDVNWSKVAKTGSQDYSYLIPSTPAASMQSWPDVQVPNAGAPVSKSPMNVAYTGGSEVYVDGKLSVMKFLKGRTKNG